LQADRVNRLLQKLSLVEGGGYDGNFRPVAYHN